MQKERNYMLRPVKCPLFEITEDKLLGENFHHLEYYPLVNQRVYSFGKEANKAQNDQNQGSK